MSNIVYLFMGKVTKATPHISEAEIHEKLRQTKGSIRVQKWLAILHATVSPATAKEIALHIGLKEQTVHNLISGYNRFGPSFIEDKPGKGGRRNQHLSVQEEKDFLAPFIAKALKGQIAVTAEIQQAYEEKIGKTVSKSVVYRLLKRHNWRKVAPCPQHPKADPEKQKSFKKTSAKKSPK
ncbi:MAG TPA: hypothetical protein ENJ82_07270 [Bacteroidetes bacterium]|nr:hypothetical protein [Bacteroidota bacterium]